jgi:hypothetical protein
MNGGGSGLQAGAQALQETAQPLSNYQLHSHQLPGSQPDPLEQVQQQGQHVQNKIMQRQLPPAPMPPLAPQLLNELSAVQLQVFGDTTPVGGESDWTREIGRYSAAAWPARMLCRNWQALCSCLACRYSAAALFAENWQVLRSCPACKVLSGTGR